MNLDTVVKKGSRPWRPSPDARDLRVWHEYDMPTVGTFTLNRNMVLFTVVGDTDDDLTVWAYACLAEDEAKIAQDARFASVTDVDAFIRAKFADREAVFVLARDLQVWRWSRVHIGKADKTVLISAATEFLKGLKRSMEQESRRAPSANVPFRVALADVEAMAAELVDA